MLYFYVRWWGTIMTPPPHDRTRTTAHARRPFVDRKKAWNVWYAEQAN
jgi:hypothetical protein